MTRVIHTGDTHVGYQQYHSPERRRDFLAALEAVVDDAVADGVDAVVHAGDLFHDRRPELQDLLGVLSVLRDLDDAGVPFLAIVGNHESTRGGQWLDLFESLGLATRLGREPVVVGDTAFYGLDFVPRSRREDLDYDFAPHDAAHAALVAHGLFTPFAHADWETETVLAESTVDFDAVLLGDNHAADTAQVEGTWVTYCGSTERTSAAEEAGRGYNIVTFDADVDVRRRALDTREFVFVTADLGPGEGVERVRERVRQHDLTDAVVVVEVTGDGEPVTPASVEEAALEAGALVARVTDRREVGSDPGTPEVSFADPDDAVRERVAGMGLSAAARDVDETVRASKVADSNVREAVRRRVEDHVDGDLGALAPAPEAEGDGAAGPATDGATDDAGDGTDEGDVGGAVDGGGGSADADTGDGDAGTSDGADADTGDGDAGTSDGAEASGEAVDSPGDDGTGDARDDEGDDDGQVSMEDYL